ncbi:hypothetical protein TRIUR3_01216 [Triticum urartu]|uniref:Uncharacterized protein n=1 Tax=Triticum urartu TaxID=4572 RepID=M8A0A6_TRIUA|nr:hypothetical protein TRIUR3_01216 [Triticum urartu]
MTQILEKRRWCLLRDDATSTYDFLDHHHHDDDFLERGEEEGYQRLEENESRDCPPSIPIAGEPSIPRR